MVSRLYSTTMLGIDSIPVTVEVDISNGLPGFHLVGLPDTSVSEACARVRAALRNVEQPIPNRKVTVNLAPGDVRKEGPRFDLAIALGILNCQEVIPSRTLQGLVAVGELSLDGRLRPVRGVLATAQQCRSQGRSLLVPRANLAEANLVAEVAAVGVDSLREAIEVLCGRSGPRPVDPDPEPGESETGIDLSQVVGQALGRRALEVAAAGGHHLLLSGPPGCGKTMLARCLPTILPALSEAEALEVARVNSICERVRVARLPRQRPFREPGASVTAAGLLGSSRSPGEVTRAHHGVLFLDEFCELRRACLEGLRVPLEAGYVEVVRANFKARYPAGFTLVAACNPCPCGYLGDPEKSCLCPPGVRERYLQRISGPLRDRLDLCVELTRPDGLWSDGTAGEPSSAIRARVEQARLRQQLRGPANNRLTLRQLQTELGAAERRFLERAGQQLAVSVRGLTRSLRVARTLADLRGEDRIGVPDLAEALQYRWRRSHD